MPLKWKDLVVTITNTGTVTEWDMAVDGDHGVLRCFGGTDHTSPAFGVQTLDQAELAELQNDLKDYLYALDDTEVESLKAKFEAAVEECEARLQSGLPEGGTPCH